MTTKEILNSHSVDTLRKEVSKANIKGYSKMKKKELIELMLKTPERFSHIKPKEKQPRAKPAPKPRAKPAPKPKPKPQSANEGEEKFKKIVSNFISKLDTINKIAGKEEIKKYKTKNELKEMSDKFFKIKEEIDELKEKINTDQLEKIGEKNSSIFNKFNDTNKNFVRRFKKQLKDIKKN